MATGPASQVTDWQTVEPNDWQTVDAAPAAQNTSAAPAPRIKPEARTAGNYASETARGIGRGLKNDVVGLYETARHPIDTATGLAKQGALAARAAGQEYRETAAAPTGQRIGAAALTGLENAPIVGGMVQHAEEGGDKPFSPESIGAAAEGVTSFEAPGAVAKVAELAPRVARSVTGTGPRVAGDLAKGTAEENAAASGKAAANTVKDRAATDKANAKLEADRAAELKAHSEKTQAAKAATERRAGIASRKSALESGVKKLSDRFQDDLKTTRDKAADAANAKYNTLNEALGQKTIQSEHLLGHLLDASEKFKGSMTEPAIFKDIEKTVKASDVISYSDLQGYYSEIGRELKKGTLPGDVYTAYNTLQEAIGGEMQHIADQNNMGPQLTDARTSWRNLKQTFYDPKSPLQKALKSKEPGAAAKMLVGKDRTAIEALAKYDPELAQRGNVLRQYHEQAAATRVPAEPIKAAPQLAPRKAPAPYPEPRTAAIKKIGAEDVQGAKAEALQKQAQRIRHYSARAAMYVTGYRSLSAVGRAMMGDTGALAQVPADIGEGAAVVAGGHALASFLENPKIVKMLTKPNPADVAAIPPELRGDLSKIVSRAKAQGIKVSPLLERAVTGAALLAPRQHPTDAWQGIEQ